MLAVLQGQPVLRPCAAGKASSQPSCSVIRRMQPICKQSQEREPLLFLSLSLVTSGRLLRRGLEFLFGLGQKLKETCEIRLQTSEGNLHTDEHQKPLCCVSAFRMNRTEMSLVARDGGLAWRGWSSSPRTTRTNKAPSPHKSTYSPIVSAFLVYSPEFHHLTKGH